MSDNKKYYYLKLKEDFFDSEEMKVLESMPNGVEYQNVYLKMCLLSLKSDGALMFKNMIPYSLEMLSSVLRVKIDTIKAAIEIFSKMELITIADTETIYMSDIQTLVGQSSTEAERIMRYRKSLKEKQHIGQIESDNAVDKIESQTNNKCTNDVQMYTECTEKLQNCTPEIRDKSIEIRDKNSNSHCFDESSKQKKNVFPKEYYSNVYKAYTDNYIKLYDEIPVIDFKAIAKKLKSLFETYGYEAVLKAVTDSINNKWIVETAKYSFSSIISPNTIPNLINGTYEHISQNNQINNSFGNKSNYQFEDAYSEETL